MFTSAKLKTIKLTYKFLSSHLIFFNLSAYYLNLSLSFLLLLLQFFTQKAYQSVHTLWYAQITIQIYSIYYLYIFLIVPSLIFMMFRPSCGASSCLPSGEYTAISSGCSTSTKAALAEVTSLTSALKLSIQKYAGVFIPHCPISVLFIEKRISSTSPRSDRSIVFHVNNIMPP